MSYASVPTRGTPSPSQILSASRFGVSVCRGIASIAPVRGLHQSECAAPSRLR